MSAKLKFFLMTNERKKIVGEILWSIEHFQGERVNTEHSVSSGFSVPQILPVLARRTRRASRKSYYYVLVKLQYFKGTKRSFALRSFELCETSQVFTKLRKIRLYTKY
jgi:hypothetical protein